jgi:hypothetical protein
MWGIKQSDDKVSEEEKRQRREAEHQQLERMAKDAEPTALAERDQLLALAQAEYEDDFSGFRFKCSRWGNWLQISISRLANSNSPYYWPIHGKHLVTSINLELLRIIRFEEGHIPDLAGELNYVEWHREGNITVRPNLPLIPNSRPMFQKVPESREEKEAVMMGGYYSYDYRIEFTTKDFVRVAEDDRIIFEGIGTLFTPAKRGADVYRALMDAKNESI